MLFYILYGVPALIISYFLVIFLFDLLLRGFAPFISSRPWVVQQILSELIILQENPKIIAFSCGRSGLIHALEKKYPNAALLGIETNLFPYIVAKVQLWIRRSRIKVIRQAIHRANVKEADLIYSHLYPDQMEGLGRKLKFECREGTQVLSTGFSIPFLEQNNVVDLPDRKGRLNWLSKNQKLFQRKSKLFKKEKKAYIYKI
ncbi:MAG: hypothetical protein U9R06_01415 [Patescibacteria group bacterium]|nr:hypothetical protein [Patescibacteria group bacterium]